MKLSKQKAKVLNAAINNWENEQLISDEQANKLRCSYQIVGFDWKLLAVYSFWIAITCFIISVGVLLADDYLLDLLAQIIDAPASLLATASAIIASLFLVAGVRRRNKYPAKNVSNEATFFFGVLMTAVSLGFVSETTLFSATHDAVLLLLLTLIYAVLGLHLSSVLIWLFALFSFGAWILSQTTYLAGSSGYFLGLNIPLRFVFVGLAILGLSIVVDKKPQLGRFKEPTRFIGLLYLFLALWLLSIFGNYEDLAAWSVIRQVELLPWSVAAGIACIAAIYIGIKTDDALTRSFGITFLLINLYTRFFEYFWESFHKTIFFAILAVSFWLIGSQAEKLWQIGGKSQTAE
ncbi:hypothetical protein MD588_06800 [Photobacterium sp. SDRW27]|uniref:hypothetical protein n=1 Tax=Photobacterium obscurum TaxID=2829490 RepID=UPI0022436F22|nr:hypothetical protein [Photobacterium obscurum]MCW8328512.1 hypothetical protein [Photobacterium obscurum]